MELQAPTVLSSSRFVTWVSLVELGCKTFLALLFWYIIDEAAQNTNLEVKGALTASIAFLSLNSDSIVCNLVGNLAALGLALLNLWFPSSAEVETLVYAFVLVSSCTLKYETFSRTMELRGNVTKLSTKIGKCKLLFEDLMSNLPASTWMCNLEGQVVFMNDTARQKTHIPISQHNPTLDQVFGIETAEKMKKRFKKVFDTRKVESSTEEIVSLTGQPFVVISTRFLSPDFDENDPLICGISFEITESVAAKAEVARLSERHRMAVEIGEIGIWERDFATQRIECNSIACKIMGIAEKKELSPADVFKCLHPEDIQRMKSGFQSFETGEVSSISLEHRIVWPTGEIRYVQANVAAQYDVQGKLKSSFGVLIDVTESRTAERELKLAKEAAEEANLKKSELLAMISHEIRTPMNGIIGFATLLKNSKLESEQMNQVAVIEESGKCLLTIVNDVLDFSKIESGKVELERIPTDIRSLLNNAAKIFEGKAREKALSLTIDIDSDIPKFLLLDPTRISQIVSNLLSNSMKFTEKGTISLNARTLYKEDSIFLKLEVMDTGIGMSKEVISKQLFKAFSQADSSISRRFGGTGLGLVICKQLSMLMGGDITVDSIEGEGSTFTVIVETSVVDRSESEAVKDDDDIENLKDVSVLVAEDNLVNQKLLQAMLKKLGITSIVLTENGDEVIQAFKKSPVFDLILMDLRMPDKSGIEATKEIRDYEAQVGESKDGEVKQSIPVIALTADALSTTKSDCLKDGLMDDFLTKPLKFQDLKKTMQKWTRNHKRSHTWTG